MTHLTSKIEGRENRGVIAGLFPATRGPDDFAAMSRRRNVGRCPDVIQSTPLVGRIPIGGPV